MKEEHEYSGLHITAESSRCKGCETALKEMVRKALIELLGGKENATP